MNFEKPDKTGKKLFQWIVDNQKTIIAQKKMVIKEADAICSYIEFLPKAGATKAASDQQIPNTATKLKARLIINTTKLFDSHYDVHIDGIWSKSLSETTDLYLLQEHVMKFKSIICGPEDIQASVKNFSWKALGAAYDGTTQALVFDVVISKSRNKYMFDQYAKKYVKNHSVGMRYVKIVVCINDEDYPVQFENWNKYYPLVANKDDVDAEGFFFAILEAKVVEGSAVVKGSNFVTPTQSIEEEKAEPPAGTRHDSKPLKDTRMLDALEQLQKQII